MSRSKPSDRLPNPSTRWLEWNGSLGGLRYYDKATQSRVGVALPFSFLLLDELKTIRGFDAKGNCRIYANEVYDTTTDPFVVKSYNSGVIAEGKYRSIQTVVEAAGGYFAQSCYIAFRRDVAKDEDLLVENLYALGNVQWSRAALSAWVEFKKTRAAELYSKAVCITGTKEGKTGNVVYRMPSFELIEVSAAAESAAQALDEQLQDYLKAYLKRTTADRVEAHADEAPSPEPVTADQIPF